MLAGWGSGRDRKAGRRWSPEKGGIFLVVVGSRRMTVGLALRVRGLSYVSSHGGRGFFFLLPCVTLEDACAHVRIACWEVR